jgi:predicted phosphoribosyltransferase
VQLGNDRTLYRNREEAGGQLAGRLEPLREADPLILALPRGGVVVGYPIARSLEAVLDVIIVRKLGAPGYEEYGFGAIGPGGVRVINSRAVAMLGLTDRQVEAVVAREQAEMDRRTRRYRGDRPAPNVKDRTIVLVDDGLATGVTARAAVAAMRRQGAHRVVLAVPVAPADTVAELTPEVDELICPATPEPFMAIGQWYDEFGQTTDEEVIALLDRAQREHRQAAAHRS